MPYSLLGVVLRPIWALPGHTQSLQGGTDQPSNRVAIRCHACTVTMRQSGKIGHSEPMPAGLKYPWGDAWRFSNTHSGPPPQVHVCRNRMVCWKGKQGVAEVNRNKTAKTYLHPFQGCLVIGHLHCNRSLTGRGAVAHGGDPSSICTCLVCYTVANRKPGGAPVRPGGRERSNKVLGSQKVLNRTSVPLATSTTGRTVGQNLRSMSMAHSCWYSIARAQTGSRKRPGQGVEEAK